MSAQRRTFDFVSLIGSLLSGILSLFRAIFGVLFPRDEALAADAAAAHVDRQTERLLANEDEPEPRYDMANAVRGFVEGLDVTIAHLPPRQRLAAILMFERHVDLSMLSDSDVEAYVRGDHRDRGLPDIWTKATFDRAYSAYMSPKTSHRADLEPDLSEVSAYGM